MLNFIWSTVSDLLVPGVLILFIFALLIFSLIRERKTEYVLYVLSIWFPLESFVLNFVSPNWYEILKYIPEVILYTLLIGLFFKHWSRNRTIILPQSLRRPFLFFGFIAVLSLLFNWYNPTVWFLGVRQLIRFVAVFLIVLLVAYPESTRRTLLRLMVGMVIVQALFGLVQYAFGGRLDNFLFPSRMVTLGNIAAVGGNELFWTPGTRVFATMGRYDQLGSFLMLGLVVVVSWLAVYKKVATPKTILVVVLITTALFLTKSRASWLAVLVSLGISSYFLLKNKKIISIIGSGVIVIMLYVFGFFVTHANVMALTEKANQTLPERIIEAGSLRAWRESYDGYGRIFFIVNTPRVVVADSPVFGLGPGNYGGGVAAALSNTREYDRLHLPFGVQNTYGQIDNGWLSLWGEFGTLGLAVVIWVLIALGRDAEYMYREAVQSQTKVLAAALFGLTVAVAVIGFFGPYFEFRTLMFNFWLIVGLFYTACRHENLSGNFLFRKV